MAKKLYLDCQSGISGDMLVGALLDLGASEKILKDTLASLPLEGFEIEINRVEKAGLNACDFLVKLGRGKRRNIIPPTCTEGFRRLSQLSSQEN